MRTMDAKNLTLEMLSIWLVALGAWGLLHATFLSASFVVAASALGFGTTMLLIHRRG